MIYSEGIGEALLSHRQEWYTKNVCQEQSPTVVMETERNC